MIKKNELIPITGFLLIIIFFCLTYYQKQLFLYPSLIHGWAQADRLSIAISFYDNGMNFFKPATLSQISKEGVVGVEFPIQAYLAAAFAHLFGRENISVIFRLLNLVISCIGLLFLFLACYKRTRDFVFSILPPLFVFCSPVFIYYTCNYLPDTAGASMAFISFYFVLDYLETFKTKKFIAAIVFLSLGTLIKTSILSYLAGFILVVFFQQIIIRKEKIFAKQNLIFVGVCAIAAVAVLYNYLNIQFLNEKYESWLFLAEPRPFKDWDEFITYTREGFQFSWMNDYLVLPQYLLFVSLVAPSLYFINKTGRDRIKLLLLFVFFIFSLVFFYLLGNSLLRHDYYVIAIFFPFLAFALIISVCAIRNISFTKDAKVGLRIAFLSAVVISFFFADFFSNQRLRPDHPRYSVWYRTFWLDSAKQVMMDAKIDKNEKILVADEQEPNLPLVYFDRKGIVIGRDWFMNDVNILIKEMKDHQISWMIIEEGRMNDWLHRDSSFFQDFEHILTKDKIVVFKLKS